MPTSKQILTAAVMGLMLAGCGQSPTAPKATAMRRPLQAAAPNGALGNPMGQPGANPAAAAEGARLLEYVRQTLAGAKGFEAEVIAKTEGFWKQGTKSAELRKVSVGYKVTWLKPAKFRAEVFNSGSSLMDGAAVVTLDGKNMTARAKGMLSFIPIQLKPTAKELANARNHTFDKYGPNTQIQRLTGPAAVWTVVGQAQGPGGTPIVQLRIDNVQRLDAEIDSEVVGIDPQSGVLRTLTSFSKGKKVVDYNFTRFSWNPRVTADTFKL